MTNREALKISHANGVYYFEGAIDENAALTPLKDAPEPIIIDMGKVTVINSVGIRNMVLLVKGWGKKKIIYRNCPVAFIDAISMVTALLGEYGNGTVESLFMPIFCGSCDYEEERFIESKSVLNGTIFTEPLGRCRKCGDLMEVDAEFLRFLNPK
jgi:anti-anti-sigma regulatory factor